ncbi:hypothetical protein [uncultured Tateyamaria sp.]|uniref:hypothetical protein n=1 Tax=uncultured Tateyamaria sp. TaxID=455651 RepID=UPI002619AF9D|nr:hypothetical protein [uncultured Tateyamaria sp.]
MSDEDIESRIKRDRQAFDDLQNEIAGRDTGRIQRFGISAARDSDAKQAAKKERAYRDALHRLLMTDPEYRKLHEDLGTALSDAETTADTEITRMENQLAQAEAELDDMRASAPKIDGKAIFSAKDGRVIDENGNEVVGLLADDIVWPPNAVSADDYLTAKSAAEDTRVALDTWRGYRQDTLGDMRDSYEDGDIPMTKDEMRDALEQIKTTKPTNVVEPDRGVDSASFTNDTSPTAFPQL